MPIFVVKALFSDRDFTKNIMELGRVWYACEIVETVKANFIVLEYPLSRMRHLT